MQSKQSSRAVSVRLAAAFAAATAAGGLGDATALAAPALNAVAVTGQAAPVAGGKQYLEVGGPSLNAAGQVAFHATVGQLPPPGSEDGPDLSDVGIYLTPAGGGSPAPVVRFGDAVPGLPGHTFVAPVSGILNSAGQLAFRGISALTGDETGETQAHGLYLAHPNGTVEKIVRVGVLETTAGAALDEHVGAIRDAYALGANGRVAFSADLIGPLGSLPEGGATNRTVLVAGTSPATLKKIVRETEPAPGNGPGTFVFSTAAEPRVSPTGDVTFFAGIAGGGTGSDVTAQTVYRADAANNDALTRKLRGGQAINGGAGPTLTSLGFGSATPSGQVSLSTFFGSSSTLPLDTGLLAGPDLDHLTIIARYGQVAPGAGGATYGGLSGIALNEAGHVQYIGYLEGAGVVPNENNVALYGGTVASPQLVARSGAAAPGMDAGAVLRDFESLALNADGEMAFLSRVDSIPGGDEPWVPALFRYDPSAGIELVIAGGMDLEIAPGDVREVSDIGFQHAGPASEGLSSSFNDNGDLALVLRFTDGSTGVFTTAAAVPEPAGLAALAGLGALALRRRRRFEIAAGRVEDLARTPSQPRSGDRM